MTSIARKYYSRVEFKMRWPWPYCELLQPVHPLRGAVHGQGRARDIRLPVERVRPVPWPGKTWVVAHPGPHRSGSALIKPPLSQCLIPDPGRMDIGDQDLKTDNLLHDDVCSADLLERESAMSFHSRRRSRPSAQTTHRPRGGTCRERTQPRIAQFRSLFADI